MKTKGTDGETYPTKKEMLKEESKKVLEDYSAVTLRQLYYRLVSKNLIPNKQSQYQYLSKVIKEARIDGKVNWDKIEDRTRGFDGGDHPRIKPEDRIKWKLKDLKKLPKTHNLPKWKNQDYYIEVWYEKEALSSLFGRVCGDLKVVYYACRGYSSVTQLHNASERLRDVDKKKKILYFGDYDPSGIDIERDIKEKLRKTFGIDVEVERVALNRELIDKYQLPPQPAKSSDARYDDFVENYGKEVVELDALKPGVLRGLIRKSVNQYFNESKYKRVKETEKEEKEMLREKVNKIFQSIDIGGINGI